MRGESALFSSAVPDYWHEVFGHIPLLWSPEITGFYQGLGRLALEALAQEDREKFHLISKIYWFLCEYGLVFENGEPRMIGAGLIASPMGSFKLKGPGKVRIEKFSIRKMKAEALDPYKFQGKLYSVASLEELASLLSSLSA